MSARYRAIADRIVKEWKESRDSDRGLDPLREAIAAAIEEELKAANQEIYRLKHARGY